MCRNGHLLIFLVLLLGTGSVAKAQDFTDTRKKTESFVRLQPASIRADVAYFSFKGISESANAPVLKKISPTSITSDSIVFKGDGIFAKVSLEPFDKNVHKLSYDDKVLTRIDRRTYYGGYGSIPETTVSDVIMIIGGDTAFVPPIAYQDLHNMNFVYGNQGVDRTQDAVYISKDGEKVYLYLFSKGSKGSYEVTWIFLNKKYYRRVLDYGFL